MPLTEKSIEYRAEVIKYIGFALMSPLSTAFFSLLTDMKDFVIRFTLLGFIASSFSFTLGVKCIFRGIDLLEQFQENLR